MLRPTRVSAAPLLAVIGIVLAACDGTRAPREDDARTTYLATDTEQRPSTSECAQPRTPCATDVCNAPVEDAVVQLGAGVKSPASMLELISEVAEESGAELVLDDACRRRLEETKVFICFDPQVRRSERIDLLTAVLSFGDVELVRLEAESPDARPRWTCVFRRPASVRPRAAGPDGGE